MGLNIEYLGSNIKTLNDIGSFQLNTQNRILKDDLIFKIAKGIDSITEMYVTGNFPSSLSLSDVTHVGRYAFANCSTLTFVSFPQCSYIENSAFTRCSALTSVNFSQCSSIGYYAFGYCSALTSLSFPQCNYIESYAFTNCSILTFVDFPQCSCVGSYAFARCGALTSANFPQCSYLRDYAFSRCESFSSIRLMSNKVVSLENSYVFSNTKITPTTGSIIVPASLVNAYKADSIWSYFSNRIFGV